MTGFLRHAIVGLELLDQASRFGLGHSFASFGFSVAHALLTFGLSQNHGLAGIGLGNTQLLFTHGFGFQTLFKHPDFSHTGLFIGLGGNRFDLGAGQTIGPDGRRLSFLDLRFSKTIGSRHGLATASQFLISHRFLLGCIHFRLGGDPNLLSFQLGALKRRLGRFHIFQLQFFGIGFSRHHFLHLQAVCFRAVANILDVLFLFRHIALNSNTLAGDIGNFLALFFQRLFHANAFNFHRPLTVNILKLPGLANTHFFYLHRTLAGFHGHFDLALLVFVRNRQLFIRLDASGFGTGPLLLTHLLGFRGFPGLQGFDFAALARFGFGLAALQFQRGFPGRDVLTLDFQLLVPLQTVGFHIVERGNFGNPLDALGIQDVVRVQRGLRRLLQVVDGHVFQHVTVQVFPDGLDDGIAEALTLLKQLHELELLTNGLQRFTELGIEQLVHGIPV